MFVKKAAITRLCWMCHRHQRLVSTNLVILMKNLVDHDGNYRNEKKMQLQQRLENYVQLGVGSVQQFLHLPELFYNFTWEEKGV